MQLPARHLNGDAAGQKNQGIEPENARKIESDPIIPQSFAYQKRARQCHEEHDDAREPELNHGEIGPLRYTVRTAAAAAVIPTGGNVIASASTGVNYLDVIRDGARHNRTPLVRFAHSLRRQMLRNIIVRRAWNTEFIRPAI